MSHLASGEAKRQDVVNAQRVPMRCRIPQRLPVGRQRCATIRTNAASLLEATKGNVAAVTPQQNSRFEARSSVRPRSTESPRPQSNTRKDDVSPATRLLHLSPADRRRDSRLADREKLLPALKRPPTLPKTINTASFITSSKGRPVITVPVYQKKAVRPALYDTEGLPDQETIKKCEELEIQRNISDLTDMMTDPNDRESLTSPSDKVASLKQNWQEKLLMFEKMKVELHDRQGAILELYSKMKETQQKMATMGQRINMPPVEELKIMSVNNNMSPTQLLKLCAEGIADERQPHDTQLALNNSVTIDMNKLYSMPNKIVATCEKTLTKRKEIIDWFETLKTEERGISMNKLCKKIHEFNSENEMLNCAIQRSKDEFVKDLAEIVDYLRNGVNQTMALQLRTEELTYELSELNSQNADLKKQLHMAEQFKSVNARHKIEELEQELKREKCKNMLIRDRLNRAEGQVKVVMGRVPQLEAAIEQAQSQNWTLELTVQQLHDQNQKLQSDFDKELSKLTESIRENTMHLEDIAKAREKLQIEKEDLEKRITELSEHYNESLGNMKDELNNNITKVVETEKKLDEEKEERKKLDDKLECLCTQLVESELRYKDTLDQLLESDSKLNKAKMDLKELETAKRQMNIAHVEIEEYRNRLMKQTDIVRETENKLNETTNLSTKLKHDLNMKEEYLTELQKQQSLLEQQLHEGDCKMVSYEEQLTTIKSHIAQLKEDFGEFENISDFREMINQQRANLLEATRQNGELAEALQKKDIELEHHIETLTEQEQRLEERDGVIKILSEKEDEHANIIKLLRKNLEMRAQADNELTQHLTDKNAEIDALVSNVEKRKLQILQLEQIILTLEDQLRKVSSQRRKDQDKMTLLEKTIAEYEAYHIENKPSIEAPSENLDNLIKILEDELGTPFDPQVKTLEQEYDVKVDKHNKYDYREGSDCLSYQTERHNKMPTKIVMGNFVKKTYISNNDKQYKRDSLNRKKAITNIDTPKWVAAAAAPKHTKLYASVIGQLPNRDNIPIYRGVVPPLTRTKDHQVTKNLQFLMSNQIRDEKKCKMFKFAGHRL